MDPTQIPILMEPSAILLALLFGLPATSVFFIVPIVWIWTNHRRKMEVLHQQRQTVFSADIAAEFRALREEIQGMRETSTQYDLSFDTTLHHLERRLSALENQAISQRATNAEQSVSIGIR